MTRKIFDIALEKLQTDLLTMGSMVRDALAKSVRSLKRQEFEASRQIIASDRAINDCRYALETTAIALIATQQPLAGDLRALAAILDIVTDLERIGDYAKGIAQINLRIGAQAPAELLVDYPSMAAKVDDMLQAALQAFVRHDVEAARRVAGEDDAVDAMYDQIYAKAFSYVKENQDAIEVVYALNWAAHNLERSADRVVNICERVVYAVTGGVVELDGED